MRQRIVATLGAIVTLGLFLLTNGEAAGGRYFHYPLCARRCEELLTSMSQLQSSYPIAP